MRHLHSATSALVRRFVPRVFGAVILSLFVSGASIAGTDSQPRASNEVFWDHAAKCTREPPSRFSSLTVEETIRRFFDARLDPTERRVFSYRMAEAGTREYPQG